MSDVETRAVIHGPNHDTRLRRGDAAVWIKTELDSDGEFRLDVADIAAALRILGFTIDEIFPEG
jgi:hypothetical protein